MWPQLTNYDQPVWRGGQTDWCGGMHTPGHTQARHGFDTPADRYRLLGFSTLLLSGLSFIATLFVALRVAFIRSRE